MMKSVKGSILTMAKAVAVAVRSRTCRDQSIGPPNLLNGFFASDVPALPSPGGAGYPVFVPQLCANRVPGVYP